MKTKTTKRKIADVAVGAIIGGAIAGPIGAVAGGLTAGDIEPGLERLAKLKPRASRIETGAEDPIVHACLKRILVPIDFSPPSRRALRFAQAWAEFFGARIRLLHVIEPTTAVAEFGTVPMGGVQRDLADRAKTALQKLARQEFPRSLEVSCEIRKGVPYHEIATAARQQNADLIIIATHGHSGLKHTLLGSTAERVVRHALCPVLTLRRASAGKA